MLLELDKVKSSVFSGGEVHINVKYQYPDGVMIDAKLDSSEKVMKLLMVTDALRRGGCPAIQLSISYLPYARQDRVCNEGEALSIKVFCDLINSQNYDKVYITDCHSEVGPALLNNCVNMSNHGFIKNVIKHMQGIMADSLSQRDIAIVSPDAGSNKKCIELMKVLGPHITLIKCDKTRDTRTGKLTGFKVNESADISGKTCIIVDDICDGGGTFNGLAKELQGRGVQDMYLAVTHGIFSKGFDELHDWFTQIYTTESFPGKRNERLVVTLKAYEE